MSEFKDYLATIDKEVNNRTAQTGTKTSTKFNDYLAEIDKKLYINTPVDETFVNSFVSDVNDFFAKANTDYESIGYANAASAYDSRTDVIQDYKNRARAISDFMKSNKESMKQEDYDAFMTQIAEITNALLDVDSGFRKAKDYYAQWATEEDYNKAVREYETQQGYLNYDIAAGERELEDMKYQIEFGIPEQMEKWGNAIRSTNDKNLQRQYHEQVKVLERQLAEMEEEYNWKTTYINNAKRIQEWNKLSMVVNNADFSNYSGFVDTSDVDREAIRYLAINKGATDPYALADSTHPEQMTAEEIAIYNYHYNKNGKEMAKKYFESIQEDLNHRAGNKLGGDIKDKPVLRYLFGVGAALDKLGSGMSSAIKGLFSDDNYIPTSATQFASGVIREELGKNGAKLPDWLGGGTLGQAAYDTITTVSYMAPSILAAYLTKGLLKPSLGAAGAASVAGTVGRATLGVSAGGSAYQQMLNQGYGKDKALTYGMMVGVSEVVLEKLIGGIDALGGTSGAVSKMATKAVSGIDNAILRFSLKYSAQLAGKIGSEAFEEGLQSVLEPIFQRAILHNDASVNWEEVAYSALLGGAMGGVFGGVDLITEITNERKANMSMGKAAMAKENFKAELDYVIQQAMKLPETTEARHLAETAQKKLAAGKEFSVAEVGALYRETAMQLTENNLTNIPTAQNNIHEDIVGGTEDDAYGIKDQIRNNKALLDAMDPQAEIQMPSEYFAMDIAEKKQWVLEKLRPTGYQVERKGFGIIDFAKKRLKNAFNYFKRGTAEEAAFEAIPHVLKNGVEITTRSNHKGRDYGTVTIAAPVTINGERGNMAVVVKKTDGNHYKVHRILTPDGSVFILPEMVNEAESTPSGESPKNGSLATTKDSASNINISNNSKNVNNEGGNQNGQAAGNQPVGAADLAAGQGNIGRAAVSDGERGGVSGQRSGQQAGGMGGSAENGETGSVLRGKLADNQGRSAETIENDSGLSYIKQRQRLAATLKLERVSGQTLGVAEAVEGRNVRVLPAEYWDTELQQVAREIQQETGLPVTFILGKMKIRTKSGRTMDVRGAITNDRVIIQADNLNITPKQIADHELFHEIVRSKRGRGIVRQLANQILQNHSEEEVEVILDTYKERLMGIVDPEGMTEAEFVEAYTEAVWEELLADAYAGVNAFGVKATRYTETVRKGVAETDAKRSSHQENGTKQTNGPNSQAIENGGAKYSADEQRSVEKLVPWQDVSLQELNQAQFEGRYDNETGMVRMNIYDGVNMAEDSKIYSYDFLTSLPDMKTVNLPDVSEVRNSFDNRVDTYDVVEQGIKNARSVGTEREGQVFVRNMYTGRILRVDKQSVRHGLNGDIKRLLTNARLGAVIGNVVQNAVPINALHNKAEGVTGTYAMATYAIGSDGREFVAVVTVEQRGENIFGIEAYDVTHAVSGRQKRDRQASTKLQGVYPIKAVNISIADLLETVKSTHQSVLSEDVLEHLGETRNANGDYTDKVKFSVDDTSAMEQELERLEDEDYQRELMESGGAAALARNQKRIEALKWQMRHDSETIQKKAERDLQTEGTEPAKVIVPKKEKVAKRKPVSESRPILAKQELRKHLLNYFSIPDGQRAELGKMVDGFADRLLKKGELAEEDRSRFFDRLYQAGVMEVPADDIYSAGREALRGGRIYVSERLRNEFGDEWNDFRRQAFGAGIYLTSDRGDSGVDQVNAYMAELLPGLFDAEETDLRLALERIVQVAEEGKSQNVGLPEYTAELARKEHVPEKEFLDAMERQMDWALRTFAEKARLEIKLRDRTGTKIAQEREAAAQSRNRQAAKNEARRLKEQQNRRELREQQRENKMLKELQQKTLKQLQWLSKNRQRAPEELKDAWDEVLGDIDLFAVGAAKEMRWSDKYNATWRDLADMYQEAKEKDPNFLPSKELERIVSRLNDKKIADMDVSALQDLYKAAVGLQQEFYHRNNVINDEMNRIFEEVYEDSKREIEAASGSFKGKGLDKLFNMQQLTPMNVLQRMGGWNPDGAFFSMAKQLERGERDIRAYTVKANRMLETFLQEHQDWVKKCDGQGKSGIWYELEVPELLELGKGDKPIFGDTIKIHMTPAQKVHMYLESKNVDNLRHMVGGRTFADKKLYSEGKRQEALAQGRTVRLAPETVKGIVSKLTEEEKALADVLEKYYNQFATEEINKVSNVLYGYDKAMGKNYAPIYTNQNYTKSELGVFDATAEGVGHMKGRVAYSKNPSYNISAIDAFERHVEQTARFCGMAIPARNWQTLLNWRERDNSTGDVITHKWGDEGKRYIEELIENLQAGTTKKTGAGSVWVEKLLSNYISAVFGGNPSIVLKQLGSIPMAAPYLDFVNFPKPSQVKNIDRELIAKYTQELAWRTMGYATPETKQLKENPNWTQTNKTVKFFIGGGAITAMDGWAASVLWPWAENKVMRDFPELTSGTEAYYQKVAELFENAVSRSQSVSDEIHQSTLRKDKGLFMRAFTMFRSDSAQAYNAIRQKVGEARYYKRAGADKQTQRKANKAAGAAVLSAISGLAWAECISLLNILWKYKGKDYRDEEGELTAESVIGEMAQNLVTSMAGTVVYGEEIAGVLGNIITGEKWYDLEAPGMEQLNVVLNAIMDAGGGIRETVAEAYEVYQNGGDVEEYFNRHGNDILGGIKEIAETAAQYFPGLPVKNVETYLLGLVKWVSPELATAYEDLFATAEKTGLSGLAGGALVMRVADILRVRNLSESEKTAETLAELYEKGYAVAVPGSAPSEVAIDKVERKLNAYQKQVYENIWGSHVEGVLDDVIDSAEFNAADAETQSKILSALYNYASELAKAGVFDDYDVSKSIKTLGAAIETGLPVTQVLTMKVAGVKLEDYVELVENGVLPEKAYELTLEIEGLKPEEDSVRVSDLQKYMEVAGTVWSDEMKAATLETMMTESSYKKYKTALDSGITTYWYFRFLNNIKDLTGDKDRDGNTVSGSLKKKIVNEIDKMDFTRKQKDTLYLLQGYAESGLKDTPWH